MNKERRFKIRDCINQISAIAQELEVVYEEEETVYDNYPENLQGSQRYEAMEEALGHIEDAKSNLNEAISSLEEVE